MRLDRSIFKCIVQFAPLISIDFLIEKDGKYLLGKRINKPAKDYYFTVGGRIFKNESIENAKKRILKEEIGFELEKDKKGFIEKVKSMISSGADIMTIIGSFIK